MHLSIRYFLCFIIFLTSLISCSDTMHKKAMLFKLHKNPVVAHRGAWKSQQLPENSIAALRHAIDLGCAGSEFDVHMTADDSLIISHDPHHHGLEIENHTYDQLKEYRLANQEELPTLQQYLEAGAGNNSGTQLVIEIKPSAKGKDRAAFIVTRVYQLVKKLHMEHKVSFISFDLGMLLVLVSLDKNTITQYLNGDLSPDQLKQMHISGLDYHFSVFKKHPEWILQAKKNDLLLNTWTVNNEAEMQFFLQAGFDFITTNEPEQLFRLTKN